MSLESSLSSGLLNQTTPPKFTGFSDLKRVKIEIDSRLRVAAEVASGEPWRDLKTLNDHATTATAGRPQSLAGGRAVVVPRLHAARMPPCLLDIAYNATAIVLLVNRLVLPREEPKVISLFSSGFASPSLLSLRA